MKMKGHAMKKRPMGLPAPMILLFAPLLALWWVDSLRASVPKDDWSSLRTGHEVFVAACATCHGARGAGVDRSFRGFETDPPDFTDCSFSSREKNSDWVGVVTEGGPLKGFSSMMPSFSQVLSREQIEAVVEYAKGFCSEKRWPPGEFNLAKPLYTGKAFPEDEVAFSVSAAADSPFSIEGKLAVATRVGARHQLEAAITGGARQIEMEDEDGQVSQRWGEGAGDIALGWKGVLWHHLPAGTIGSLALDAFLPTGDEKDGFSHGIFLFKPALAIAQIIPFVGFVQLQAGAYLSTRVDVLSHELFWRGAVGHTFRKDGYRRAFTPMVEFLGGTEWSDDAPVEWDVAPQLQIALSRRQHVRLGAGAKMPLTNFDERSIEVKAYLVWDWYDGGFTEGW